ncbi:MAG TPA: hypothetical protein PLK94_00835 [Alphaproteobacteria bacterium]|nr:hypothetical protein [Alphaproteobacteria bacterium]HOO49811.1 hypothetical protein [Alphaproteobacteria bacterium]
MIEAVNAISTNAQTLRAVAEQTATTQSFASNPARVQAAAVIAPYLSPHVDLNGGSSKPIFIVRDSATGEHVRQFPTEGQIRAYQRAKDSQARAQAQALSQAQFKSQEHQADLVESSVQFRQARQEVKVEQKPQPLPGSGSGGGVSEASPTVSVGKGSSVDTNA